MTASGEGIDAEADEMLIEDFSAWPEDRDGAGLAVGWPATGGLVRVDDELVYYESAGTTSVQFYSDVFPKLKGPPSPNNKSERQARNPCTGATETRPNIHSRTVLRLQNVKRGVLGSKAAAHGAGTRALVFDGMPVSSLKSNFAPQADAFTVGNAAGFPAEGYAWIGNDSRGGEVVSWTERSGASLNGCKFFRGRYGTSAGPHESGDIVRCLPFRYWDREARSFDGEGLAFIQGGYAAADAIWDSVELQVKGTEEYPLPGRVRPRVLVRFDGLPNWDAEPSNQEGGIYEFRNRTGVIPLKGGKSGGIAADQIEMRVFWEFMPGAFQPSSSDWKRTFSINLLRATYRTPLIMRRLDEIERR